MSEYAHHATPTVGHTAMREFLMSELQDGHTSLRFVMLLATLCATMWLGLQTAENKKPL